jgi:hypothetical protein
VCVLFSPSLLCVSLSGVGFLFLYCSLALLSFKMLKTLTCLFLDLLTCRYRSTLHLVRTGPVTHRMQINITMTLTVVQLPIHWVPVTFSLAVKRPGCGAHHSPPSGVEVENAWSCTSTLPYAFMMCTGTSPVLSLLVGKMATIADC